jgi:hypothetical protein
MYRAAKAPTFERELGKLGAADDAPQLSAWASSVIRCARHHSRQDLARCSIAVSNGAASV